MRPPNRREDLRSRVHPLLEGYVRGALPPTAAYLLEVHRDRCSTCGRALRALRNGTPVSSFSPDLLEHIGKIHGLLA